MTRQFIIPGECMVRVKGGAQMSGDIIGMRSDLGLTSEPIIITPTFYHEDVRVDDFGPQAPADVQGMLASVNISMTVIHFDEEVLDICWNEAMGGGLSPPPVTSFPAGVTLAPAGRLLSRFRNRFWSGWHFISLNLATQQGQPWRFYQSYLTEQPAMYPIGTEVAAVRLNWRAIPYSEPWLSGGAAGEGGSITVDGQIYRPRPQMQSSGAIIWDRDEDPEDVLAEFPEDLP